MEIDKWILQLYQASSNRPFCMAISGAQGSGKSTLCRQLVETFQSQGLKAASVSIDDFYLTHEQQNTLAASHPLNPYLQQRGYPGTHDVSLAEETIRSLKEQKATDIPRYDKSAYGGEGDRFNKEQWTPINQALDILLFEGWFLGFQPKDQITGDVALAEINEELRSYQVLMSLMDGLIYLKPENPEDVVDWRIEAEEKMKASGKSGMTLEQVRHYINQFLPAYREYRDSVQPTITYKVYKDRSRVFQPT